MAWKTRKNKTLHHVGRAMRLVLRACGLSNLRPEAGGHIRWQRPAFQNPAALIPTTLTTVGEGLLLPSPASGRGACPERVEGAGDEGAPSGKHTWPASLPEQMALLARLLTATPQSEPQLAARIAGKGPWKKHLPDLLQTLVALGRARQEGETWRAV